MGLSTLWIVKESAGVHGQGGYMSEANTVGLYIELSLVDKRRSNSCALKR